MGRGGTARRIYEDSVQAVYEYASYDYNFPETAGGGGDFSGRITVFKLPSDAAAEEGIYGILPADTREAIYSGAVKLPTREAKVKNSGSARGGEVDIIAVQLARKISAEADGTGKFPDKVSYHV